MEIPHTPGNEDSPEEELRYLLAGKQEMLRIITDQLLSRQDAMKVQLQPEVQEQANITLKICSGYGGPSYTQAHNSARQSIYGKEETSTQRSLRQIGDAFRREMDELRKRHKQ